MKYLILLVFVVFTSTSCANELDSIDYKSLGNDLYRNGNYEAALEAYSSGLQQNPADADLFFYRSLAEFELMDFPSVISDLDSSEKYGFKNLRRLYYQRAVTRYYLTITQYMIIVNGLGISEDFFDSTKTDSKNFVFTLEENYKIIADFNKALNMDIKNDEFGEEFRSNEEIKSKLSKVYLEIAKNFFYGEFYDSAAFNLNTSLALFESCDAFYYSGLICYKTAKYSQALEYFEKAIALIESRKEDGDDYNPLVAGYYYFKGLSLLRTSKEESSCEYFQFASELHKEMSNEDFMIDSEIIRREIERINPKFTDCVK